MLHVSAGRYELWIAELFSFPDVSEGNLLVIAFVSYFGARLHRPKIIAVGCVLMSFGTFLIAMPHFIIGRYADAL